MDYCNGENVLIVRSTSTKKVFFFRGGINKATENWIWASGTSWRGVIGQDTRDPSEATLFSGWLVKEGLQTGSG